MNRVNEVTPPPKTSVTPAVNDTNPVEPHKPHSRLKSVLSTIAILLIAPLIALFLTAFVFQSYQVDGASMQTTLFNNDRLIVWKLPRSWAKITGNPYIPKRGDVIIFTQSGLSAFNDSVNTKQLVKRVIGLPGERVVVKDGVVTVYNKAHPEGFQPDAILPYGANNHIPTTEGDMDVTLGKTKLFVCGDNRGNSTDSRIFGPIDADKVIGKLAIRILPLSKIERF